MQYKMKYTSYLAALSVLFATACAKEEITEYDPFNLISNFAWNTDLR